MENPAKNASIVVENLNFTYPERERAALQDVTLTLGQGEFVVLCGASGCGKTTLLRQLKPALTPHGAKSGGIFFEGTPLNELPARDTAAKIGFVMQSPEHQVVTDKVWHELAFGLESLGLDTPSIRLRTAEMASFFGMQTWFYKNVAELSGGQKQLLALASVMALQPSLLLLDEPTSQLDPIAAADFLASVKKINRELGVTVLLTDHRLEEALPMADRVVVMEQGRILCEGTPAGVGERLRAQNHGMFAAMPVPMRVWAGVENTLTCPVTVREGRAWISQMHSGGAAKAPPAPVQIKREKAKTGSAISIDGAWFKYEKDGPDIIKGLSFEARAGELTAVLGGNGTGKTTMLSLIAGLNRAYRGKIRIEGEEIQNIPSSRLFAGLLGVLPQNPQSLFVAKTVREDLMEILSERKIPKEQKFEELRNMAALCRLEPLLNTHPYDLSGGEQQRAALAKVLLLRPRILLLDEPTKGLDSEFKIIFAAILRKLTAAGAAVVMVSHDIEFCAEYADRCALFFDGSIVTENTPKAFFSGNSFYTSAANRMARHVFPRAVSAADVICALGGGAPEPPHIFDGGAYSLEKDPAPENPKSKIKKLTPLRFGVLAASAVVFAATLFYAIQNRSGFLSFISGGSEAAEVAASPAEAWRYSALILLFTLEIITIVMTLSWKRGEKEWTAQTPLGSRRLSKRTLAAAGMILFLIPLTIYVGSFYFGDRKYYLISMLVLLETMLPFALVFERRRPQARELVVLAVLCAIAVAGRAAFFMLPQFKPVAAIVIIAAVAFGGEAGFLTGAVSAFVSNLFFGQGIWTPWQMFAFGIIGFLAGVLFKKGLLLRSKTSLCVFGGLAVFFIYGGIMNPASVIILQPKPTRAMFLLAYLQGIPFDLVHAVATVFFLAVAARPMLEKLDRIKVKYGLLER
ncbi:MAG: ATP-binding cassette domain-containing protein [Oscillospiraceae bacterium]|nr:ATP-binding cassette domain-containing protein [Oscillospiraceae bacterium]